MSSRTVETPFGRVRTTTRRRFIIVRADGVGRPYIEARSDSLATIQDKRRRTPGAVLYDLAGVVKRYDPPSGRWEAVS